MSASLPSGKRAKYSHGFRYRRVSVSGNRGTIDPVDRSYGCVPNHRRAIRELAPSFGLDRAFARFLIWAANFFYS